MGMKEEGSRRIKLGAGRRLLTLPGGDERRHVLSTARCCGTSPLLIPTPEGRSRVGCQITRRAHPDFNPRACATRDSDRLSHATSGAFDADRANRMMTPPQSNEPRALADASSSSAITCQLREPLPYCAVSYRFASNE